MPIRQLGERLRHSLISYFLSNSTVESGQWEEKEASTTGFKHFHALRQFLETLQGILNKSQSSPLGMKDRKGQDSLIVIELQENKPYRIKKITIKLVELARVKKDVSAFITHHLPPSHTIRAHCDKTVLALSLNFLNYSNYTQSKHELLHLPAKHSSKGTTTRQSLKGEEWKK